MEQYAFHKATIIDKDLIEGTIDDQKTLIEVLDGGLPENTVRVTLRENKRTPDGNLIIGAFIEGRVNPVTIIGRVKTPS